jgi:ADP-dependent NAD(P)H-hydrate dehydratase / NAD(P)H-hydrate epimerase
MRLAATASEMRSCDEEAIRGYGIPGIVLMENAARGTADEMERVIPGLRGKHILIVCGRGNNGGDGFALARHLFERGCSVTVAALTPLGRIPGDAGVNAGIIRKMSRKDTEGRLTLITSATADKLEHIRPPEIIVDAILGTGFRGSVKPGVASVLRWMNGSNAIRFAIDVPSGVDADTGEIGETAVRADYTCTMGLLKRGLLFSPGRDAAGEIAVIGIQIPPEVYRRASVRTFLIERDDVRKSIPVRPADVHKYRVGKVFVLAGSRGLTGAAALTSMSALRTGAGAVVLGIPASLNQMMEKKLTEVMTLPLDDAGDGTLHRSAWNRIRQQCEWADVIAAGPGLSQTDDVREIIRRILKEVRKPIVLDADGLNAFTGDASALKKSEAALICTPHSGEFARLSGVPDDMLKRNRVETAREFARRYGLTLVLKGGPTIIASMNGNVYINSTGNPGMATAGAGDVLTGIIAGLWAQGLTEQTAACSGVFIHGAAGDAAAEKYGELALTAGDIQEELVMELRGISG